MLQIDDFRFLRLAKSENNTSMTLRAAIIGYGKMGRIRHNAMERHGGFEGVVACDTAMDPEASVDMVTDPM